jgi:hypothetical protein
MKIEFESQIGKQIIFLQVSGAAREERYEYCTIMRETKLINNAISFNFFHVHVKDISKVTDNGNQYKQKLILWYWTKNYFLMASQLRKYIFTSEQFHM